MGAVLLGVAPTVYTSCVDVACGRGLPEYNYPGVSDDANEIFWELTCSYGNGFLGTCNSVCKPICKQQEGIMSGAGIGVLAFAGVLAFVALVTYLVNRNGRGVSPDLSPVFVTANVPQGNKQTQGPERDVRKTASIVKTSNFSKRPETIGLYPQSPPYASAPTPLIEWSKNDVEAWLRANGHDTVSPLFKANSIDGLALTTITSEELVSIGVALGKAKKLISLRDAI